MSVASNARAQKLHGEVLAYFDQVEKEAIPKAKEDLALLDAFQRNADGNTTMSDRIINLIFKEGRIKYTIKSANKKAKKKRKQPDADDDEDELDFSDGENAVGTGAGEAAGASTSEAAGDDEFQTDAQERLDNIPTMLKMNATLNYMPKKFTWTAAAVRDLQQRAKNEQAYLRRLRARTWDKLDRDEQLKIREYVDKMTKFVDRIESQTDYMHYLSTALPLLAEIERVQADVDIDAETLHTCSKSVTFSSSGSSAGQESAALTTLASTSSFPLFSASSTNILQNMTVRSESHARQAHLLKELEQLVHYTLNLYGHVRGSGSVVQNAELPAGAVQPLVLEAEQDPLISSGFMCAECGVMRILDQNLALLSCPKCATTRPYQGAGEENFNFGDAPIVEKAKGKNYKAENYFLKWIRKVKGELKGDVPDDVWALLFRTFYVQRLRTVTKTIVRRALKNYGLSQYYDMVPLIAYRFNEVPLPDFTDEEEVLLAHDFDEYREAFKKCPQEIKQRNNLLSYPYVARKMVERRGWLHYMQCFPLLDGREFIRRHDCTWKWICENKDGEKWKFIPTL